MAHTRSAEKRVRQNMARRARNRAQTSALRSQVKKLRTVVAGGSRDDARKTLSETAKAIDQAAAKGLIKKGTAARYKSRLARSVNAMAPAG
ncbi:MAG: 30S ribosomal protein S20 [Planctomycetota bacterium]